MVGTHFETCSKAEGGRRKVEGLSSTRSPLSFPRSAFTLTELLVVITIIAILAGLITGAALNALNRAKQAAITLELQQIGGALDDFKNELGAYPPNGMIINGGPSGNLMAQNDFIRMFKKAFPRHQEDENLILAIAGAVVGSGSVQNSDLEEQGMNGAEATVFWLGGFSKDVSYPISGPGGPAFADGADPGNTLDPSDEVLEDRNLRYEFDLGRLGPRKADGTFDETVGRSIRYRHNNIDRQINFWTYTPSGSNVPLAYYDTSRHAPFEYDLPVFGNAIGLPDDLKEIYALKQLREGVVTPQKNDDVVFVENKKFQILHCGIDDIWGDGFENFHYDRTASMPWNNVILAPEGPFIGDVADTLGNFMPGPLEDKQE